MAAVIKALKFSTKGPYVKKTGSISKGKATQLPPLLPHMFKEFNRVDGELSCEPTHHVLCVIKLFRGEVMGNGDVGVVGKLTFLGQHPSVELCLQIAAFLPSLVKGDKHHRRDGSE